MGPGAPVTPSAKRLRSRSSKDLAGWFGGAAPLRSPPRARRRNTPTVVRVTKQQAAENRSRILTAASRLFRERGLSGVGVDALTEAAGLTHGSLYSQFGSKERLAEEALREAMSGSGLARIAEAPDGKDLAAVIDGYLSAIHRDRVGKGCAFAALGCEMARQPASLRQVFTEGLKRAAARLARLLPDKDQASRDDRALALLSGLVGALVLARAVDDPALSDRFLAASAAALRDGYTDHS